jgi:opacity protein-like surface antigen
LSPLKIILISVGLGAATSTMLAASECQDSKVRFSDHLDHEFWFDWSSRHTSKGRDYLDGKGAFSQGLFLGAGDFGLELSRSGAIEDGIKEFNLELSYFRELESFSFYGAYQYSDWSSQGFQIGGSDLAFGATYYDLSAGLWIAGDMEYSLGRNGFFSEVTIGSDLEFYDWLTLTPSLNVGFNSGFFDDGHDGWNHAVADLSATLSLAEDLNVYVSAAYNWAINRESDLARYSDDANLEDFFWAGLTFSFSGDREESEEPRAPDPWELTLGSSAWATAMSGSITIEDDGLETVRPLDDSSDRVHTGLAIELSRRSWSLLLDGSYVSFGAEVPPPLSIFEASSAEVRVAAVHLAAGYRVFDNRSASVDLLAGVRYNFLESKSELGDSVSRQLDWFDPSLGVRIRMGLLENWLLSARAEYGGFELGSDQFWQADLGLEYEFSERLTAEFRYQHFEVDYTKDNDAAEFTFRGPRVGVRYRF